MVVISFLFFLGIFTLVGIASVVKSKSTTQDYLLAGSTMKPWLVGLSAIATSNSGFMFTGMIGYTYMVGLSAIWIILPWMLGDLVASFFIHKRLRAATGKQNALTFSSALSRWHGGEYKAVRIISAIIIVVFLSTYAAAQLSAGSKALYVLFDWDYKAGAIIGSLIVIAYCFAGGIRASIWTDVAQSVVMLSSMALLCFTAIQYAGGVSSFIQKLHNVSPDYLNWFPSDLLFGVFIGGFLLIVSWLVAGWGIVGQPHIMVRFMTMRSPEDITRVRYYYYSWYTVFFLLTLCVGFAARILLPGMLEGFDLDSETALPVLAQQLLPEVWVGLILAGLFAATMSTADSLILSSSAALTRDLSFGKGSYLLTKLGTIFITMMALFIALYGNESVFGLVLIAWSALGAGFAPLLTVYAFNGRPSEKTAVTMMITAVLAVFAWRYTGYSDAVYEILPGFIVGFSVYGLSLLNKATKAAPTLSASSLNKTRKDNTNTIVKTMS